MKNIKKISAVLSAITIMGTCGVTTVSAIDENETDIGTCAVTTVSAVDNSVCDKCNKIYTLEELFEMSKEEFFELDNAELCYSTVKNDVEDIQQVFDLKVYGGISGKLYLILDSENDYGYKANETEMKLASYLGNKVKYEIDSPISLDLNYIIDNNLFYGNIFYVSFPDYELSAKENKITDEQILDFAKCWYCVKQIIDLNYYGYHLGLSAAPGDEKILTGDVNVDKQVNVSDIVYMTKANFNIYKFTDLQNKLADLNGDGKFTLSDQCMLVNQVLGDVESAVQ